LFFLCLFFFYACQPGLFHLPLEFSSPISPEFRPPPHDNGRFLLGHFVRPVRHRAQLYFLSFGPIGVEHPVMPPLDPERAFPSPPIRYPHPPARILLRCRTSSSLSPLDFMYCHSKSAQIEIPFSVFSEPVRGRC